MAEVFVIGRNTVPRTLGAGAYTMVVLPGTGCDITVEVLLKHPGETFDLAGVYLCGGNDRVRIKIDVRHEAGGCTSRQLFKGIASGRSKAVFDGLIYVGAGTAGTKASQTVNTLLTGNGALAESRPQLEIYADDVECSHGATSGYLNPDEQFYMRSRGITEDQARHLQMISFISPVLSRVDDALKQEIYEALSECQD